MKIIKWKMEMDNSKFICNHKGCGMTFFTKNHLENHENSHEIKLNLDLPKTVYSDQTPTPTRFIRNCEAVGLFDDLNSVNPFEESFGRALECNSTGNIVEIISENNLLTADNGKKEDTLHTPQLVPRYYANTKTTRESVIVDIPKSKSTDITNDSKTPPTKRIKLESEKPPEVQQQLILPKPTCNNIMYITPLMQTVPHSQTIIKEEIRTGEQNVKDKLKNIILNGKHDTSPVNVPTIILGSVPTLLATPLTPAILKYSNNNNHKTTEEIIKVPTKKELQAARKQSTSSTKSIENDTNNNNNESSSDGGERSRTNSVSMSEKSGDKAQRNRAAAQRYRHKIKIKNQEMQEKLEKAQRENLLLKKEVTELKRLLLYHKDCPVTKAMNSGERPL